MGWGRARFYLFPGALVVDGIPVPTVVVLDRGLV